MGKRSVIKINQKEFVVDNVTGEIKAEIGKEGQLVYVPIRAKRGAPFVVFYQDSIRQLVHLRLSSFEWKFFLYLASTMLFENWIPQPQKQMAIDLGVDPAVISRSLKSLRISGILQLIKYGDADARWRVSPSCAWKGDVKTQTKALTTTTMEVLATSKKPIKIVCPETALGASWNYKTVREWINCSTRGCKLCESNLHAFEELVNTTSTTVEKQTRIS